VSGPGSAGPWRGRSGERRRGAQPLRAADRRRPAAAGRRGRERGSIGPGGGRPSLPL